jgi:virginiamycin B lyase
MAKIAIFMSLVAAVALGQTTSAEFAKFDASALPFTAKVHIGGDPDWLGIGFGSVWVSVPKNNEILRIDPLRNTVRSRIHVDDEPCYGIGAGPTRLWVLNCKSQTLTRIDPKKGRVDLRVPVSIAPEGEGGIAVRYGGVWFVGNQDGHSATLVQVDPVHGRILRTMPVGKDSAVVRAGFGSIWVTSSGEGKVYRVDPVNGRIIAQIDVAAVPRFVTIAAGSVWVLSQSDGSVSRIDPATNKIASVSMAGIPGAGGDIAAGGNWIWVAAAGTPLTRINLQSGRIADQYGNYPGADAIRFGFNSVWISDHKKGDLWRIDPGKLPVY